MIRNILAVTSATLLSLMAVAPALAAPHATVVIQTDSPRPMYSHSRPIYLPAPPPPRREAMPRPRRGQMWVAGHWEWRGKRLVWTPGYWVKARHGHHYRQPQWQQTNGRWHMRSGGWDRDGDGIPNRHDRRPDNPHRR